MIRLLQFGAVLLALAQVSSALPQWTEFDLRQGRSEHATVIHGGLVYVAGGRLPTAGYTNTVEVSDPFSGHVGVLTLSSLRRKVGGAALGSRLYFAGGEEFPFVPQSDRLDVWDTGTGIWSLLYMPYPVDDASVVAFDSRLFVCGGALVHAPSFFSMIQVLDASSQQWTLRPIRFKRAFTGSDERWLVAAGKGAGPFGDLEIYDSQTGTWDRVESPLVSVQPVAVRDGVVYLAGPAAHPGRVVTYDIEAGSWGQFQLTTPRAYPTVGALGPFIVFAHGFTTFPSVQIFSTADVLNTLTGSWRTFELGSGYLSRGIATDESGGLLVIAGGAEQVGWLIDDVDVLAIDEDLGQRYCSPAFPNSTGQAGSLHAVGFSTAADNYLTLVASELPPGQLTMFLVAAGSQFLPHPGGSMGALCLAAPFGRLTAQAGVTNGRGRFAAEVDLTCLPLPGCPTVLAGSTFYFQAWHRDLAPQPTSNFTDALQVSFD